MLGVRRDLCGSSSPTPLPKQGHLQQAAQDLVQVGLEYLQRRRLQKPSGQPVPVLHHPQSEEVLPRVQVELRMLQLMPVAPCPVAGHHWKESGPDLLTPTLKIFIGIYKVPSQPSLVTLIHITQKFGRCNRDSQVYVQPHQGKQGAGLGRQIWKGWKCHCTLLSCWPAEVP